MKKTLLFLVAVLFAAVVYGQEEKDLKGCAIVRIQTNYGAMKVALYNETPLHRDNFLKLAKEGFYDGLLFHRVISSFMIQAGDPNSRDTTYTGPFGAGDIGYKVPAEITCPQLFHKRGALAAARQADNVNPEKESSGCQFYIVQGRVFRSEELDALERRLQMMYDDPYFQFTTDQRLTYMTFGGAPHLDGAYTVFGEVIEGLDVIDKVAAVKTGANDRPVVPVRILEVTVLKQPKK